MTQVNWLKLIEKKLIESSKLNQVNWIKLIEWIVCLKARDSRRDRYSSHSHSQQHSEHQHERSDEGVHADADSVAAYPAAAAAANLQASLAALQAGQLSLGQVISNNLSSN